MKRFLTSLYVSLCGLLLLLPARQVLAQVWPTQVNTIIIPPYSPYTSDYVNTPGKMIVNLLLRDINASNVRVKLRINIEGQGTGVRLTTNPNAAIPPIILDGGVSLRLSDADLAPYFRAENLIFNGLSASEYTGTGGKLPEDLYRICFEVYEFNTGAKLSVSNGCANAWVLLNDPPLLNLPTNGVKVSVTNPTIVTFSWTPRHKGSPNSAFATEYLFQLVELMPGFEKNPTAAFLSSIPLFETTTAMTQLVYGMMGEVPLEAGRSYAWRVKAKSKVGVQEMDLFKNQGFSEIYYFNYSGDCATPLNVTAKANGTTRLDISWTAKGTNQAEYIVSYKKSGVANAVWFDEKTSGTSLTIKDLAAGTLYDYKVRASCGIEGESMDSDVDTVSTPAEEPDDYTCGMISPEDTISNMKPLASLTARDEFKAGMFKVKITKVSGSDGNFTGEGYISIPLLKKAKIAVTFSNILVNTDYKLAKGVVLTAYDPTWSGVNDLDKYFEGGGATGSVVTGKDVADVTVDVTIPGPESIKVTTNATGGATLNITGADGSTTEKSVDKLPATVKDKDGNIYKVDTDGTVSKIADSGNTTLPAAAELNTVHPEAATVTFLPHTKQAYAFDAFKTDYLKSLVFGAEYEKLADNYYVSAKAIGAGKTDIVTAQITIKDAAAINVDSVRFVTATGTRFVANKLDNTTWEITVLGGPADDAQELYAVATNKDGKTITLGKLLIASYELQERKVVLVPVNGGSVDKDAIAQTLQRIYGPLGVTWQVVMDEPFTDSRWDLDGDGLIDVGSGGLLATRTREMKQLSKIYSESRTVDSKAVYLFILSNGKDKDKLVAGDMPRAQQFGYIFTNGATDMGWTVAHEIAHGAYHLNHSFDGYGFSESDLVENLMNYKAGQLLTKFQWDAMHDPAVVWGLFETDSDGEATAAPEGIKLTEAKNVFATPDGAVIQLPAGAVVMASCNMPLYIEDGPLFKFFDKGQVYEYITKPSMQPYFFGYKTAGGTYYEAAEVADPNQKEIYAVSQVADGSSGKFTLTVTKRKPTSPLQKWNNGKIYSSKGNPFSTVFTNAPIISTFGSITVNGCGMDWGGTSKELTAMASRLNSQWNVEIDDGSGVKKIHTSQNGKGTLTYKWENGKYTATVKLDPAKVKKNGNPKYYKEGDLEATAKAIEDAINEKLSKFKPSKDGKSDIAATTTESVETWDGGEFNFGNGVTWAQWGMVLMDAGTTIYEEAAMPKSYWKQDEGNYGEYPVHAPPILCGAGDAIIDEVTSIPQLAKLGLEVVTDKEKALGIWTSVKELTPGAIKALAVDAMKTKWDAYFNSASYVVFHESGKDGVQLAMAIMGASIFKGANATEGVQKAGLSVGKSLEDVWTALRKQVDFFIDKPVKKLKEMFPNAKVGIRGSMANGRKVEKATGKYIDFNPNSFDVDAFIVDDNLAKRIKAMGGNPNWLDIRALNDPALNDLLDKAEASFKKKIKGYRDKDKFTFKVWSEYDYKYEVQAGDYHLY